MNAGRNAIGTLMVAGLLGMLSCQKTSKTGPAPITPLQTLVNSDTTLTLFHQLLLQANETVLLADNPITLLLPTNAALRQSGFVDTVIDKMSATQADRIVRYQYLTASKVVPDSAGYKTYPTLLGLGIFGMKDNVRGILFNNISVSGNGAAVGRAFVYRLTRIITPAADSLPSLLQADSTLSFLAEAFRRTHLYDSLLLSGSFTLLAPVNNAFRQAGYDSIGMIDSANINALIQLVEYQVLKGAYLSNTFPVPGALPNLQGGTITISQTGGILQFAGPGNTLPAQWLGGDQPAGNTLIVHRINQVLSP